MPLSDEFLTSLLDGNAFDSTIDSASSPMDDPFEISQIATSMENSLINSNEETLQGGGSNNGMRSFFQQFAGKTPKIAIKMQLVQQVINAIVFIFIIFLVLLVIYILYKLYHAYPRPMMIGRTAPLEPHMRDNVRLIILYLRRIRDYYSRGGSGGGNLRRIVQDIFREGDIVPEEEDLLGYTPEQAPYIYLNFMFKRALSGDGDDIGYWHMMELHLINRLSGLERLQIDGEETEIYNSSGTEVRKEVAKHIKRKVAFLRRLEEYFGELDCRYLGQSYNSDRRRCTGNYKWCKQSDQYGSPLRDPLAELARQHLSLIIFRYTRDLERGYDLRKSGGIGNFVIYVIYMSEYVQFIFHEKIPSIWSNFTDNVSALGQLYWDVVSSPGVARYMSELPMTLAGVDTFRDMTEEEKQKHDNIFDKDGKRREDIPEEEKVTEHFFGGGGLKGLGNLIKSLTQLLPNLLRVIMALLFAITNPLRFLTMLLGMVIGLVIYILYMVIALLGPLFYIPAFVVVLVSNVVFTVFWTALFICLAVIYFVLWILDFTTNGLVFSLLRCENLPNNWHESANYIYDNIYRRFFLCTYPCASNYLPNGWFCTKKDNQQPSYCPQQHIMNNYTHHVLNTGSGIHPSLNTSPLLYQFNANAEYVLASEEEKEKLLEEFHDKQRSFAQKCSENMAPYQFVVGHICQNLDEIARQYSIPKEQLDMMRRACHKGFCKYYYLKNGCRMTQRPYLRVLKTAAELKSKFLHLLRKDQRQQLTKDLQNDLQRVGDDRQLGLQIREALRVLRINQKNEKLYIVHDGFEKEEELRQKKVEYALHNIPNSARRYSFCENWIEGMDPPDIRLEKRKKGMIVFYVIYALLLLIIVSFGFILLYNGVKGKTLDAQTI